MNFFERQQAVRTQSRRLLLLFVLAVASIVFAVDVSLLLLLGIFNEGPPGFWASLLAHRTAIGVSSLLVLAVIGIASLSRMLDLRAGGAAVARELGGTPVPVDGSDPGYRRLRNVVEEVAIASSVPVPAIFVLEQEAAINAFAAGWSVSDAAIAVTRGAMDRLNRDELQGVVAHEFSHILNGDMRLNIRLMGILFGILTLSLIGRQLLRHAHFSRARRSAQIPLFGLALVVLGGVGLFFARVIKAGVSRQREFLADASAVQFTRQTQGLASALKKVGGVAEGSRLSSDRTEQVSHMLFGDGVGYSALFATHPPLVDRIRRLDPQFDPRQYVDIAKRWSAPVDVLALDAELAQAPVAGLSSGAPAAPGRVLPTRTSEQSVSPAQVAGQVGNPAVDDYRTADRIHREIPKILRDAARSQTSAMETVFALLIDTDTAIAARQLSLIANHAGAAAMAGTEDLLAAVATLHPMSRLPLAAMAFPAIRRFPRQNLQQFVAVLERLIHADGKTGLFEYCLAKLIGAQVTDALDPPRSSTIGKRKLVDCETAVVHLFSVLAHFGHDDEVGAKRAFNVGIDAVYRQTSHRYALPSDWVGALDRALPELNGLDSTGKELLIEAMVSAIATDNQVVVAEAELLRVICAALHCPLPPLLSVA